VNDALHPLRDAGSVQRYHTTRTHRRQTIAEHSWGVATLLMMVCDNPPARLLGAALLHDVPEVITGDVPAPAKWRSKPLTDALAELEAEWMATFKMEFPELDEAEARLLKWADSIELVLWCLEEVEMGNRPMLALAQRGHDHAALCVAKGLPPRAVALHNDTAARLARQHHARGQA
jgi:5'-deoxynucleotidase